MIPRLNSKIDMPSTLLKLPAEIRNEIIGLAIPASDRMTLRRRNRIYSRFQIFTISPRIQGCDKASTELTPVSIAILKTCKQIYHEWAGSLRWTKLIFLFDSTTLLKYINELELTYAPPLPFQHITNLEVEFEYLSGHLKIYSCLKELDKLVKEGSLKSLTLKAFYNNEPISDPRVGYTRNNNWLHWRMGQLIDGQPWATIGMSIRWREN